MTSKQHKITRENFRLISLILTLICINLFVTTPNVFAYVPPDAEEKWEAEQEANLTPVQAPLTPDGNLTLMDDIFTNNEGDKQFITAVSKSGNWFYIVVDRAGDSNNVHLLNLVDEADLMSLMTGEPVTVDFEKEEPEPEPTPAPEPKVETEVEVVTETPTSNVMPMVFVACLGVMGLLYYFKIYKKPLPIDPLLDDLEEDEEEKDPFDENNDTF